METIELPTAIFLTLFTVFVFQSFTFIQKKLALIWLNPMLLSIAIIIPTLIFFNISFEQYTVSTQYLSNLLEPAIVALGFPLYQHLHSIKYQWKIIFSLLFLAIILVISVSFILTMLLITIPSVAISLSLKSVTTPIGLAITQQLQGDTAITAFAIILAGLFGAFLGPRWLNFINVKSAKAQGLAIGCASHALGTAALSKISYEHAAYSSLALIFSAIITALISPYLITMLLESVDLWL